MLLAAHLLVITENFTKIQDYKRLAAFIDIVPINIEVALQSIGGTASVALELTPVIQRF